MNLARAVALVLLVFSTSARAAESDADVLKRANEAFAAGARTAASEPARAAVALAPAVTAFRQLIDDRGLHSAGLNYNLGNAWFLSGDLGHAIAAYRRAQRLDASLPGLEKNLAAARAKVAFKESPSGISGAAAASSAIAWHTVIPQRLRLWLAAGACGLAWLTMLARLRGASSWRPPLWLAGASGAVCVLCAASLWWQHRSEAATPPAVIVADRVVGRKGPDELGYQPSFTEPLRAGFEVEVLETRGEWRSVRLQDNRVTWVPAASVELL